MNKSGQKFVEILKKINYPLALDLHGQSFDWMFNVKEMLPFLEWFCTTVNSDNLLTTEEIADYTTLQSSEVTLDSELLEKAFVALPRRNQGREDKLQKTILDLEEEIPEIEKHINVLETQKKYLIMKEIIMSHNQNELESLLEQELQKYQSLEEIIPITETKIITELERLISCIQEMNDTLMKSDETEAISLSRIWSQLNFKEYLKKENIVFESIKFYLNSQLRQPQPFAQIDNFASDGVVNFLHISSSSADSIVNCIDENARLKNILQITEESCLEAYSHLSKCKAILNFYKDLLEKKDFGYFLLPFSQLRLNLQKAQERLERYKQEHQFMLETDVPSSVSNYVQAQSDWIAIMSLREKLERHRSYLKKQVLPIDVLYDQRARLELLLIALAVERSFFRNIRDGLQQISNVLEKELLFLERESQVATEVEKTFSDNYAIQENSFFLPICSILELYENSHYYLALSDVPKRIESLSSSCKELQNDLQYTYMEQMQLLKNIENSLSFLDELLYHNKWESSVHPSNSGSDIISVLSKLELRQYSLEDVFLNAIKENQKKKKLLGHNKILQKGRHLFIFALTNREKFYKLVNEIKFLSETQDKDRMVP